MPGVLTDLVDADMTCFTCEQRRAFAPFHAVELQLRRLRRLFPDRWVGNEPSADLPLFTAAALAAAHASGLSRSTH